MPLVDAMYWRAHLASFKTKPRGIAKSGEFVMHDNVKGCAVVVTKGTNIQ